MSPRSRELRETSEAWADAEARLRASPIGQFGVGGLGLSLIADLSRLAGRLPTAAILERLVDAAIALLEAEEIGPIEPDWPAIESDISAAVDFRKLTARRRRWAAEFDRRHTLLRAHLLPALRTLVRALPDACFVEAEDGEGQFDVPLADLLEDGPAFVEGLVGLPFRDELVAADLLAGLRTTLRRNLLVASGFAPMADWNKHRDRLVLPKRKRGEGPARLAQLYLAGTPFQALLDMPVPFEVSDAARFEHCHILGGTGHGKTQLLQRMIHSDLVAAETSRRSVVVIDSQGDLINKVVRLSLFSPEQPDSLHDRLVLIDPADVEFPAALNLFDAHLSRLREYRPVDQERVLNGVIELYEMFFGALLGAELTQKQGVVFKYLARLMLAIEGSTIHTLMALMEDGRPFRAHMQRLDGSARYFFEKEFFDPSFNATKKQILKRLWGVLATPAFERMFAQTDNKLDLFAAMNEGKIVLVSTAKDLLKQEGSQLFGRFFIGLIAQAALERSTLPEHDRTPTMVYVDEAQEYFDDSIETILNQARKYRVGLTLAHQTLDQLSPRLRSALLSNTSMKCVGGVSAKDARGLADELHTTPEFIESMRRRAGQTEFAVWLKHLTPSAIRLTVRLGFLESQPLATEEAFAALMAANRARYCGTAVGAWEAVQAARHAPAPPPSPGNRQEIVREEPRPQDMDRAPAPEDQRLPMPARPSPPLLPPPREAGKGGSQHRYVQHLIKGLAEEQGFRVVIEEPAAGGQVDVALHREGMSVACEISVTSTAAYEAQNLAKCVRAGFDRVWAIAGDAKRLKGIEQAARARLSGEELGRVDFLTTEDIVPMLEALLPPEPSEATVRGYKVKVSRTPISPSDAKGRRAMIARVVAQSMRRVDS
jgi:hypothetical protein